MSSRIEDYGLIGNMHTAALVGRNGSIDWMCMPRFDSPSLFCAILDDKKGGFFRIAPVHEDDVVYKQFYWPATNVLVTRFLSTQGAAELIDFMAVDEGRSERRGQVGLRLLRVAVVEDVRAAADVLEDERGLVGEEAELLPGLAQLRLALRRPGRKELEAEGALEFALRLQNSRMKDEG